MQTSIVQPRGSVVFPEYTGERVYMVAFYQHKGLPEQLKRWQPTVDMMLAGIETDQPIYIMIDQSEVKAGASQRRPGVHIDGYWIPELHAHGSNGHGSSKPKDRPADVHAPHPHWSYGVDGNNSSWANPDFSYPEGLLLASTVTAACGYVGDYVDPPKEGGDCAHVDTAPLTKVIMQAGTVYAGNVSMLHESLPVDTDCVRTLVRLNVPGWTPSTIH